MERTGGYILNRRGKNNRIENVDKIALQYWSKLHKDHDVTRKIDKSYKHYNVWRICDEGFFFCELWQQPCFANLKLMLIKKKSTNIFFLRKKFIIVRKNNAIEKNEQWIFSLADHSRLICFKDFLLKCVDACVVVFNSQIYFIMEHRMFTKPNFRLKNS